MRADTSRWASGSRRTTVNPGDDGDLYKATSGVALSNATIPESREWDGTDSGLQIRDITAPGQTVEFSVGTTLPPKTVHAETSPNLLIPDNDTTGISSILPISPISGDATSISVSVEIIHSWISDLKVSLRSPAGTNVVLHNREGHDGDDIKRTWTSNDFAELQRLHGEGVQGDWTLHVVDKASADVGRLLHWEVEMEVGAGNGDVIEDQIEPKMAIPDANAAGITSILTQAQAGAVKDIVVSVDIEHTYIGDLHVELVAPSGLSAILHDKEGEWHDNISRSYDVASTPALAGFVAESIPGDWQLRVRDLALADQGQLNAWSLKIWY